MTVTVRVKGTPVQDPAVGVTVYVAVWAIVVGLVSVPKIDAWLVPAAPPVIPPVTTGTPQLYVVPAGTIPFTTFTGVEEKGNPLHMVLVMLLIEGVGLTVTVTVKVAPLHEPTEGVTV